MSTPIGNNTTGLQEILRKVQELPDASGGGGGTGGETGNCCIANMELPVYTVTMPDTANYVGDVTTEEA